MFIFHLLSIMYIQKFEADEICFKEKCMFINDSGNGGLCAGKDENRNGSFICNYLKLLLLYQKGYENELERIKTAIENKKSRKKS